jgi:hypothetical protein
MKRWTLLSRLYHYSRSEFGGDGWSRTSSAEAADLQSTGVTNFPTSPKLFMVRPLGLEPRTKGL